MENSWIYVDSSSDCSHTDSDKVDSETEAELYSRIHHESNLSCINSENINKEPLGLLVNLSVEDDSHCVDKKINVSTLTKLASEHTRLNQIPPSNFSDGKRKSSEMDTNCEKLSPAKKHKSEFVLQNANLECMTDSHQLKINDIQNKNSGGFNSNSKESNNKNDKVVLHSSDSDSDIWIEPTEKSDLRINLLKNVDTVFLSSSDSDSEPDVSSPFGRRNSVLRNLSMPNIKTDENLLGLWHINSEDLYRTKKRSHRYHDNFDVTCSNCNRKGHTFRMCSSPKVIKCFVCGGNHMGFRCSNRVCSNCHASGHDRKNCWREAYKGMCHLCHIEGHAKGNCPDLWRRYHLTTSPIKIKKGIKVPQNINLYCWNCGKGGHFGAVCPLSRPSRNNFSTWPCVVSYDNPKGLLQQRLSVLRKCSYLSMENFSRNTSNVSRSSENKAVLARNKSSNASGSNEENIINKNKKGKLRTGLNSKLTKTQDKEKNFPRTPKKSPIKHFGNFVKLTEDIVSPQALTRNQLKKLKRKWINQEKRANLIQLSESLETETHDGATIKKCVINSEDDVPESVKLQVEKTFRKWKKNRLRRRRQKERELIHTS